MSSKIISLDINGSYSQIKRVRSQLNKNWYFSILSVILALGALATLGYFGGLPCAAGQTYLSNISFQLSFSAALILTAVAATFLARRELLKCDQADANESFQKALLQKDQVKELLSNSSTTFDSKKIWMIINHLDHHTYSALLQEAKKNKQLAYSLARNIPMFVAQLSIAEDPESIRACCKNYYAIESIVNKISEANIVENCPEESKIILKRNLEVVQSFTEPNSIYFNELQKMISQLEGTELG